MVIVSSVEVVAVAVVEAIGVPIVVAAATTVVVVSTKEDPAKKRWEQRLLRDWSGVPSHCGSGWV